MKKFWARPTIAWNLECEARGMSKHWAHSLIAELDLENRDDMHNLFLKCTFWFTGVVICVLCPIFSLIGSCIGQGEKIAR